MRTPVPPRRPGRQPTNPSLEEGCDMATEERSFGLGKAGFQQAYDLSRRSLLRLTLTGGAMLLGAVSFAAAQEATAGSSEKPQTGGTLTIGADADPIGLDPTTVTAFSSFDFLGLIYSGLLRWTPDMKVEPDLASSYEQPDPTTYVFKL